MAPVVPSESLSFEDNHTDKNLEPVHSTAPLSVAKQLDLSHFAFSPRTTQNPSSVPRRSFRTPASISSDRQSHSSPPKRKTRSKYPASHSSSPRKKVKVPSGYAPPEIYAHLPQLPDVIVPDLICVFIGLNPGVRTAQTGHAYSHPSNLFWKLLHKSGCTTRLCRPEEDGNLPALFALGNTNIVARPSKNGAELSKAEMDAGVAILEEKIRRFRPEAVALVGKSIWESVWRVRHGKSMKKADFTYGWQDAGENMGLICEEEQVWRGARVFVACSTSGLAATLLPAEKEKIWAELGSWVQQRREIRGRHFGGSEINA